MRPRLFQSLIERPTLLAALAGAAGMAPIVFHPETGWDAGTHLSHASFLLRNWPHLPQWNPEWFRGIPFLLYYPPLTTLIIASAGTLFGLLPAYLLVNVATAAGLLAAASRLAQEISRSRAAGHAAAGLLMSSGIFWGGFYVEGHLPNHLAALLLLAGLLLLHRSFSGERKWLWPASILIGLVPLAHHLTATVAAPILVLVFCLAPGGPRRWILPGTACAALSLGVAAWYVLPLTESILAGQASFAPAPNFTRWTTAPAWLVGLRPTFYTLASFAGLTLPAAAAPFARLIPGLRTRAAAAPPWSRFYAATGLVLLLLAVTGWHLRAGIAIPPYRLKIFAAIFISIGSGAAIAALLRRLPPFVERRALPALLLIAVCSGTLCIASFLASSPFFGRGAPSRELASAEGVEAGQIVLSCDERCEEGEAGTALFLNAYGTAWQYDGGAPDGSLERIWGDLHLRKQISGIPASEQAGPLREKGVDLLFLVRPSPGTLRSYLAAGFRPRLRGSACALLEVPGLGSGPVRIEGAGDAFVREIRPDRIAARIAGAAAGTIVRLQTRADRFWSVRDGGGRLLPSIVRAGFAAVRPGYRGEYELVFSYRNPFKTWGLAITSVSLAFGLAAWLIAVRSGPAG